MKILIVDDEEAICKQLQREMQKEGFKVEYRISPLSVLKDLKKSKKDGEPYNLLFLNIRMPGMDGFELLEEIKKLQLNLNVIFITGYSDEDKAIKAIRLGAFDYLNKPISLKELYIAIFRVKQKMEREEKESFSQSVLVVDDEKDLCDHIKHELNKEGYLATAAYDGEEGLDYFKNNRVDMVIADLKMPRMSGLEMLKQCSEISENFISIIITGHGDHETAIKALRMGVFNYLKKPILLEELIVSVDKGIDLLLLRRGLSAHKRELEIETAIKNQYANNLEKIIEERIKEIKKLSDAFKATTEGIVVSDLEAKITDVNKAALKMYGTSNKEDLIGKNSIDLIVPEDREKAFAGMKKVMEKGYVKDREYHITTKSGSKLPVEMSVSIMKGMDGEPVGFVSVVKDITERKQAEEKIKHLNLVLHAIRNVNQLIVREKDREKLLKGACKNLIKTRGYHNTWIALLDEEGKLKTCAEVGLGKDFLPMIELLKRGKLTTCSQKALKQQEVVITEDPASTCTECPLAQKYSGLAGFTIRLEHSGKVYGLMSVSIPTHLAVEQEEQALFKEVAGDIAYGLYHIELDEERKQAKENLKNAKDELQMIMDSVPALIIYKDIEGRVIRANKTLANSLKVSVKDIIGKTTEELFPKEQAENMRKDDKEVIVSGKPKRDIIQPYDTPEGTRWAIIDKMPYKDKEGKITGVIAFAKDITVQRKSEQKLQQTYQRLKKTMNATIDTVSKMIEAKDPYTYGHQQRVCQLAVPLARELGLSEDKIEGIRIASLIHDIGKIGLPTEILSKPSKLTDIEFGLIKGHSQTGYDILNPIDFPYPIAQIVLQHHERLNGSGYPNNLKGDKILLEARILGVVDVVEAMSFHRPYRPALGIDVALEEISKNKGILYDPEVVDVCIRLIREKGFKF